MIINKNVVFLTFSGQKWMDEKNSEKTKNYLLPYLQNIMNYSLLIIKFEI